MDLFSAPNTFIVAFTGHRPDKLGGYHSTTEGLDLRTKISIITGDKLYELKKEHGKNLLAISGMAQGFDQMAAIACLDLDIPLIAAIPCNGQSSPWPQAAREQYEKILVRCQEVKILANSYSVAAMHNRNKWMVDNSHHMIACWDGSPGGTGTTIHYAKMKERSLDIINPRLIKGVTQKG